MGAFRLERRGGWRTMGLVVFATVGCLAWGVTVSAQASAPPSVFEESVSHITEHDARLEASINPNGLRSTYQFRLESGCLPPLACLAIATYPLPSGEVPASSEAHLITLDLNSAGVTLRPDTKYRYSIEARSSGGTTEGPSHLFTTAPARDPVVEGESVSNITPTDATLEAQINPGGLETSYEVWVGALPCVEELGGPERCEEDKIAGTIPAGFSAQTVSVDIAKAAHELKPNSSYLYNFRATNMDGTTYATNREFKTAAASTPVIESELVSRLTSTDATLEAQINTEGLETTYNFYLQEAPLCFKATPPCERPQHEPVALPAGKLLGSFVAQSVSVDLASAGVSLSPGEHYEYWVTATSASGTTAGHAQEFTAPTEGPVGPSSGPLPAPPAPVTPQQAPAPSAGDQLAGSGAPASSSSSTPGASNSVKPEVKGSKRHKHRALHRRRRVKAIRPHRLMLYDLVR